MFRKVLNVLLFAVLVLSLAACSNKRVKNPIADVDSKQPDKVLFDRAMEAMKKNKFDVARLTLQTLINTYPDSEFVARAKLSVADAWYHEGGSAAWAQAEAEYNDFKTFFPNMTEASYAQNQIALMHYRQMEKPDRDFTHAKRAEEEYKQLILQYPDSPLVTEAKERLLEVQEVLAEREFRIGRFYFLRQSWAASIARLKSVVDSYPLYSGADEALYMIGQAYEGQIESVRKSATHETIKSKTITELARNAAEAYSQIITRYPVMERVEDAGKRLAALSYPVPEPTADAIARNRSEEESRGETGRMKKWLLTLRKRPDVSQTARVGEPNLMEPKETDATQIVRGLTEAIIASGSEAEGAVSVETVREGAPPPNEAAPRSDQAPPPAPQQVNQAGESGGAGASKNQPKDGKDKDVSSSKKKKKKGLGKLNPF